MIDVSNIVEMARQAKSPYWKIFTRAQSVKNNWPRICESNNDEEGADLEMSLAYLESCLNMLMDGKYLLRHWNSKKTEKVGYFEVEFIINKTGQANANSQAPQIGGVPSMYNGIGGIGAIVEEKLQAKLNEIKLKELETKIIELEAEREDPAAWKTTLSNAIGSISETAPQVLPQIAVTLTNMITGIFGKFAQPAPALHGAPEVFAPQPPYNTTQTQNPINNTMSNLNPQETEAIEKEMEDNAEAYSQILFRLRMVDADLLNTLSKMAAKAESNPSIINSLKMFL